MVSIRSTTANFILRLPRRKLSSATQPRMITMPTTSVPSNQSQPSLVSNSPRKADLHQSVKSHAALTMSMANLTLTRSASTMSTSMDAAVETVEGEGETSADRIYDPTNYMNNAPIHSTPVASEVIDALLQKFRTEEGSLTSTQYEEYVKNFADKRSFGPAFEVIQAARKANAVTPKAYTCALNAVRRTLHAREIRTLFGDDRHPSYGGGNTVNADDATHSHYYDQAKQIVDWMEQDNIVPESSFYDGLALQLCHDTHGGIMLNIAMSMEKRGIQPSSFYYNRMLDTLMRCGYSDRAVMLFNRMVFNDVANVDTYVAWMNVMIDLDRIPDAVKAWNELKAKHEGKLNTIAYNVYIKMCLKQGEMGTALDALELMTKTPGCQPTSVTARVFIGHLMDHPENIPRSRFAFEDIFLRAGFPENSADYAWLLRLWARFDQPRVLTTFNSMKEKGMVVDSNIVHAFLSMLVDRTVPSEWKMSLVEDCLLQGRQFTPHPQGIAILAPKLSQNFLSLIAMLENSPSMNISNLTVDLMMRRMLIVSDYEGIIKLFEGIKGRNRDAANTPSQLRVYVNTTHRNFYLTALLRLNRLQEAQSEIRYLDSRRLPIFGRNAKLAQELGIQLHTRRNNTNNDSGFHSSNRPYFEQNDNQASTLQNNNAKNEWQRKYIGNNNNNKTSQNTVEQGMESLV